MRRRDKESLAHGDLRSSVEINLGLRERRERSRMTVTLSLATLLTDLLL